MSHVALRVEAASVGGLFILEMSAFDPQPTSVAAVHMSAFGGKAEMTIRTAKCPLITQSEGKEPRLTSDVVCNADAPSKTTGGRGAMRILSILLAASAALVLSSPSATHAASKKKVGVTYDPPPHASTTGMAHRSPKASRHGANAYGFCPPGQAKKPGRGSAFRC